MTSTVYTCSIVGCENPVNHWPEICKACQVFQPLNIFAPLDTIQPTTPVETKTKADRIWEAIQEASKQ